MPVLRARLHKDQAPSIKLQQRDKNALLMLYYCDGLMSERQLLEFCYRGSHEKNATKRLLAMFDNRYINRNNDPQRWAAFPQLVYWLAEEGYRVVYDHLAGNGIEVQKNTRNVHVNDWKPITLLHHLQVNDVFLKILRDLTAVPDLQMGQWVGESFFRSKQWKRPEYMGGTVRFPDKEGKIVVKPVEPDGFFVIKNPLNNDKRRHQAYGFALEVDRGTEQQVTSAKKKVSIEEKLRQGAALVDSPAYKRAFGLGTGRCLMVTTSWQRAENMMYLAREADVAWAWYFTTFEIVTNPQNNILINPIWQKAGMDGFQSIITLT